VHDALSELGALTLGRSEHIKLPNISAPCAAQRGDHELQANGYALRTIGAPKNDAEKDAKRATTSQGLGRESGAAEVLRPRAPKAVKEYRASIALDGQVSPDSKTTVATLGRDFFSNENADRRRCDGREDRHVAADAP